MMTEHVVPTDMGIVERTRSGKVRITPRHGRSHSIQVTLIVLVALSVACFAVMSYGRVDLFEALAQSLKDFGTMMLQPGLEGHFTWATVMHSLLVTVLLSVLTTIISAVLAFFLGLAAARNLSNPVVSNMVKGVMSVIRAIPTILWVLVFTVAIGLGPEAAVIGISFHSLAYLTKSYSESFEEVDEGVIEALRASGAGFWQTVFQALCPEMVSKMLSWTFIRFEINFANAVAVGAFAGAGGIGYQLFQAGSFYYNLHEVGVIVYCCLIVAFALELVSIQLRKKFLVNAG